MAFFEKSHQYMVILSTKIKKSFQKYPSLIHFFGPTMWNFLVYFWVSSTRGKPKHANNLGGEGFWGQKYNSKSITFFIFLLFFLLLKGV